MRSRSALATAAPPRRSAAKRPVLTARPTEQAARDLQRSAGNSATTLAIQRFGTADITNALAAAGGGLSILGVGLSALLGGERGLVDGLIAAGLRDRDRLTNIVFWLRDPDRIGSKIGSDEPALAQEWVSIRDRIVSPALRATTTGGGSGGGGSGGGGSGSGGGSMSSAKRTSYINDAAKQAMEGDAELKAQMEAGCGSAKKTVDEWFADHVPDATFLGLRIGKGGGRVPGVHKVMADRLALAESELRGQFPGKSDDQIRTELGIRGIGGLRRPKKATGGDSMSLHCFGLAIDINAGTNPFVGYKKVSSDVEDKKLRAQYTANRSPRIIERAMLLLHGEAFNVETKLAEGRPIGELYDIHARASQALADYLSLAGADAATLTPYVERAADAGDPHNVAWWQRRLRTDADYIKYWDFGKHDKPEETGYMDLPKKLVLALTGPADLLWGGEYKKAKDIMHFDVRGVITR